jgi:hypothetical protein
MEKCIVMGAGSLARPLSVKESVILGADAGHKHTHGSENIFIGKGSGYLAQGDQNIYIGSKSGFNCEGSGNIFLGTNTNVSKANNTLLIGNAITASFLTGHVVLPSLHVKGDIVFGGNLFGKLYQDCVRVYDTNVGNVSEGSNVVSFGDRAGYQNTGQNVVAIGAAAGYQNKGHSVVAIGERAAVANTGMNVIAIGNNAGLSNKQSGTLFIGDFIEGTTNSLTINRPLSVGGWTLNKETVSSKDVELTSSHIALKHGTLTVSDTFHFSKPVTVLSPKEYAPFYYFSSDLSCVQQIGSDYYGLGENGHVYTSKGKDWTPIRSPILTSLTKTHDDVLVGYGSGMFARYSSNGWIPETRDEGEYSNTFVAGSFAVGSALSNHFYEDEGVLLQRVGTEWRLYPGKYTETFTDIKELKGTIYASGPHGFYEIIDRSARRICSQPITYIGKSPDEILLASDTTLSRLEMSDVKWLSYIHTFNQPITRIFWDETRWLVHTHDGVFAGPDWVRIHKKCSFLTLKPVKPLSADITVPSSIKVGKLRISEKEGLVLNDGVAEARVYDTAFNPIPITLNGIKHVTIEKDVGGSLCFNVLAEDGTYSQVRVSA